MNSLTRSSGHAKTVSSGSPGNGRARASPCLPLPVIPVTSLRPLVRTSSARDPRLRRACTQSQASEQSVAPTCPASKGSQPDPARRPAIRRGCGDEEQVSGRAHPSSPQRRMPQARVRDPDVSVTRRSVATCGVAIMTPDVHLLVGPVCVARGQRAGAGDIRAASAPLPAVCHRGARVRRRRRPARPGSHRGTGTQT
jgi:hypothetical protein